MSGIDVDPAVFEQAATEAAHRAGEILKRHFTGGKPLEVEQKGGIACHTGRHNCFFRELRDGEWVQIAPVLKDPNDIYKKT